MPSEKFMKKWEAEREHGPRMYMSMCAVQLLFVVHMLTVIANVVTKKNMFYHLNWSLPYLASVMLVAVIGMVMGMVSWKNNERKYLTAKKASPASEE